MLIYRKTALFLAFVLLQFAFVYGQERSDIKFYFENDSVAVEKGATFTNFLVIENKSSEEITIQNITPHEKYPGLLYYPKNEFSLEKGESKRVPFKLIVNLEFLKLKSSEIKFNVSYTAAKWSTTESASFFVIKEENKNIAIYTGSYENFINPALPDASIQIFVENQGFSKRTVKIDLQSVPEGLEISPKQQTLSLDALERQIMEIRFAVKRQNALFPEFNLQAVVTDLSDNAIVGSNTIHLIVLSTNRQVIRDNTPGSGSNYGEVGYIQNSSGFNYLQLKANRSFRVTENLEARLNVSGDYFVRDGRYNFYETWMELQRKNTLLRLGNVSSGDYDYPVFGRGGKFSTDLSERSNVEIFALENYYNLYSNYFQQDLTSTIVGGKYAFGNAESLKGKVSYVFEHDPRSNIDTQVASANAQFSWNSNHLVRAEVGLSHEKGLLNKDENAGASTGFNYDGTLGKWKIQSLNSFATKSYAGLKRGAFYSNQRINRQLPHSQLAFLFYQNSRVDPEFLSFQNVPDQMGNGDDYRYYFNSSEAFGAGYQFSVRNWNFLLSPRIETQKIASYNTSQELFSYRLNTNVGTTLGPHALNWEAEFSYSHDPNSPDWFNSLKTTLSYRYRSFSLNGTAQWNANSVFDLYSFYGADHNFANYNLYSSYNFQMLNKDLTGSFSAGISYSELYKNLSSNISGNLEYKISPTWSSTAYFNFSGYKLTTDFGSAGTYSQFKVGIKKYFSSHTAPGNHKVVFQLFEDKNFNGILETGEAVLSNEIVKLSNFVAITDREGKVIFQNVPEGIYQLRVNESLGGQFLMNDLINVNKNINRQIGLVKKIRVHGILKEVRQAYDAVDSYVTGIVVYAKSADGTIYTAIVNQKNEFEFFLKEGKYEIYIENDKYSYVRPAQSVQVSNEYDPEMLIFEYKKKDTNIKVKKF